MIELEFMAFTTDVANSDNSTFTPPESNLKLLCLSANSISKLMSWPMSEYLRKTRKLDLIMMLWLLSALSTKS